MKQPSNKLKVFDDDPEILVVDVICDSSYGGFCTVGVGRGKTKKAAYRAAARRLRKLANEAERLSI